MSLFWLTSLWGLLFIWVAVLTGLMWQWKGKLFSNKQNSSSPGFSRWSLVKFDAFTDTGGEQSFVLALLDNQKNGILLTSLHGRGVSRFYIKKVMIGKADQELSLEEKKALKEATYE